MKKYTLLLAAFLLLLSGCGLLTLHPIFTPDQLVMDSRLLGKWKAEEGYTVFEPAAKTSVTELPEKLRPYTGKFYLCTRMGDDGSIGSRDFAFMVKIGNHYFLDLYPLETPKTKDLDPFFTAHDLKMHTITSLEMGNGTLKWEAFKDNYVKDLIKNKQVRIRHTFQNDMNSDEKKMVITASTAELQAFLEKYGDRKEAYDDDEAKTIYRKIN